MTDIAQATPPTRKRTHRLSDEVGTALADMIRGGALRPGDKLPTESALMAAQGVSRTVVREAISSLQAAGLVETRHGIGTFVKEAPKKSDFHIDPATVTTIRELLALLEFRISVETETAGLAAARRTPAQLADLRAALDNFRQDLEQGADSSAADFRFHAQIAAATGNRYFIDIINHLGVSVIPRTRVNTAQLAHDHQSSYLDRVQREHEDILDAIARGDSDAARAAMRNHLTNSRERLRRAHEAAEGNANPSQGS